MKFYNVKTKSFVDVPEDKVNKKKIKIKNGKQIRYAFVAEHDGSKLTKFINEETFKSSNAKEVS